MLENIDSNIFEPTNLEEKINLNNFFSNQNPIEVDIGCGKGRFLTAKALKNPNINFIGIDKKANRINKSNKKAVRNEIQNLILIKGIAEDIIPLFPTLTISVFYIYHPDPWPKRKHHKRRLLSEDFLKRLYKILINRGKIHIATDHKDYFDSIKQKFNLSNMFKEIPPYIPPEDEKTDFEVLFLSMGAKIYRYSVEKVSSSQD